MNEHQMGRCLNSCECLYRSTWINPYYQRNQEIKYLEKIKYLEDELHKSELFSDMLYKELKKNGW